MTASTNCMDFVFKFITFSQEIYEFYYKRYFIFLNFASCLLKFNILYLRNIKHFSVLIYSYINTSGNWKNEKLCGNTTPAGRSVFTQFRVFPIFMSVDITVYQYGKNVLYFFYNIAQRTLTEEWREIFRVDIISTRLLANQRSEFTNAIL